MNQLILGTAQFGSAYGVTNALGRLDDDAARALLEAARAGGITRFDTAADYGDSQERLGRLAPGGARYVTKFSLAAEGESVDAGHVYRGSMSDLRVSELAGVMFHRVLDLVDDRAPGVIDMLRDARSQGEVERIGVSIYDDDDLQLALTAFPDLDLLQIPGNIIDRRLLENPAIARLREGGAEIHVRSALLQGVLLAEPASLGSFFAPLAPVVQRLGEFARANGTTTLGLLLRYLRDHDVVDSVVVGATTTSELGKIVHEWNANGASLPTVTDDLPTDLLDPRVWPR